MTDSATASDPGRETRDRALFDGIAESYTRKDLHPTSSPARRQRLLQTLKAAPLPERPDLLEPGCGAGFSARYLEGRFGSFLGVDYSDNLIEAAGQHNAVANAEFECANIKDLDLDASFDAVIMVGLLHHLDDIPAALHQLVRALKPGGWLIANEPQPGNPLVGAARAIRKRIDKSYSDEQDQLSGHQLNSLYTDAGLESVKVIPQGLFSTPFAEVPLSPAWLTRPAARLSCGIDTAVERMCRPLLHHVSWNLIACGRKP